jgi:hypothetical protein
MLPEYRAISFNRVIEKGGRTKPWSVLVDTPNGVKPFVVKMFSAQLVHERDSVTNEVLGCALAREFDLPIPEAALIEMDMDFQMTINDGEAQQAFDHADERVKFATELIEGNYLFNPSFKKYQAAKMIDLDTLYGFDNLIRNPDRGDGRPNLLVKSKSAYLIDHELAFMIDNNTITDFHNSQWDDRFSRHHIFWNYLRNSRNATKREYFNTFGEYLRRLNIDSLNPYFQQLSNRGFNTDRHHIIRSWLADAKHNSANFVTLLKSFIA